MLNDGLVNRSLVGKKQKVIPTYDLSDIVIEFADLLIFGRPGSPTVMVYHIPAVESALNVTPGRWCLSCLLCLSKLDEAQMLQVCTRKGHAGHGSAQDTAHMFSAALKAQAQGLKLGLRGPRNTDGSPVEIPPGSLLHMGPPPPIPGAGGAQPGSQLAIGAPPAALAIMPPPWAASPGAIAHQAHVTAQGAGTGAARGRGRGRGRGAGRGRGRGGRGRGVRPPAPSGQIPGANF